MKSLNILIVGTGMYVCGRGTDGYGTIMPAICEWKKRNHPGEVYIAGATSEGIKDAKKKISAMQSDMDIAISVKYFPVGSKSDGQSYKEAVSKIPRPAACIVAVPDDLHRAIAGSAIEAGLHTLVVKPLAPTLKEVRELIAIQDKNKVYCAVEFHKRLDLANLKMKDILEKGSLGDPLYFVAEFSQRKNVPTGHFKKWVKKTNVFQYLGVHYVDIIYYCTNAVPKRVMALGQKNWIASGGIDVYDSIQGVIEWEMPSKKRFTSYILTNWIDPESTSAMSDQKIKVICAKGRFESDQKNRGITIVSDEKGVEEPNPYFCSSYGPKGKLAYRGYGIESVYQFLRDVERIEKKEVMLRDLEPARPTFRQALVSTAVLEGVNESLKNNGRWVIVKKVME